MDRQGATGLIVGDFSDPWVEAIAASLPPETTRLPCGGDLPDSWPAAALCARTIILHRSFLTTADADRVRILRTREAKPLFLILCLGPQSRYHQLERWGPLVDAIVPEATAIETAARHLQQTNLVKRPIGAGQRIAVVSENHELRMMLVESCQRMGFTVDSARRWDDAAPASVALWDVPVLEEGWDRALQCEANKRKIVALCGFADRETVALARENGAAACLDLPCDLADLGYVLDRLITRLEEPGGPISTVPPAPALLRGAATRAPAIHREPRRDVAVTEPDA